MPRYNSHLFNRKYINNKLSLVRSCSKVTTPLICLTSLNKGFRYFLLFVASLFFKPYNLKKKTFPFKTCYPLSNFLHENKLEVSAGIFETCAKWRVTSPQFHISVSSEFRWQMLPDLTLFQNYYLFIANHTNYFLPFANRIIARWYFHTAYKRFFLQRTYQPGLF